MRDVKCCENGKKSNAQVLLGILEDVVENGADDNGYPKVEYEELVYLTQSIGCPYVYNQLCTLNNEKKPNSYIDCDACKAHWLMEEWEG